MRDSRAGSGLYRRGRTGPPAPASPALALDELLVVQRPALVLAPLMPPPMIEVRPGLRVSRVKRRPAPFGRSATSDPHHGGRQHAAESPPNDPPMAALRPRRLARASRGALARPPPRPVRRVPGAAGRPHVRRRRVRRQLLLQAGAFGLSELPRVSRSGPQYGQRFRGMGALHSPVSAGLRPIKLRAAEEMELPRFRGHVTLWEAASLTDTAGRGAHCDGGPAPTSRKAEIRCGSASSTSTVSSASSPNEPSASSTSRCGSLSTTADGARVP